MNDTSTSSLGKRVSDATIFMHEAIARNAGLTGVDHKYLGLVLEKEGLTAGELAGLTGLTTGAVTGLIDRLEKKKLVKRQADAADRRKIMIVPNSATVNRLFTRVHLDLQEQVEALAKNFTKKEMESISRYLEGTIEIMNNITRKLNRK